MEHEVKQGEHLSRIATQYGFRDPRAIWDCLENEALRQQRADPNVLFPGDRLFIPDKNDEKFTVATGQSHRFRVSTQKLKLRLVLRDAAGQPIANASARLTLEGETLQLVTDATGQIEQPIPATCETGSLTYEGADGTTEITFKVGHLDPVSERSGQHARLVNLGYYLGPRDRVTDEDLRSAIEEFQCENGLPVTGSCDSASQAKLQEVHGA